MKPRSICVFCGSCRGTLAEYAAAAEAFGRTAAQRGIELVTGGGRVGLMGVLADASLKAGGRVVGVIPQSLSTKELAHDGLTRLHVVGSMHERKALMTELCDAFLTMPGGYGTFDELCEALSWSQLRIHAKPVGLWNLNGFFDPFLAQLDRARQVGGPAAAMESLQRALVDHVPSEQIEADFTLLGQSATIDPLFASERVLRAPPDVSDAGAAGIFARRAGDPIGVKGLSAYFGPSSNRFSAVARVEWDDKSSFTLRVPFAF